ncbi:MAG: hypothetical protein IMZ66_06690 [Planctomycetes bacterium]|nr:hypothetical protein [Planctomycetota bacterium]
MSRVAVLAAVVLGLVFACGAAKRAAPSGHLAPVVIGTDDLRTIGKDLAPPAPAPAKPAPAITVDEKTGAVRVPVVPTGARGVVEWMLAAGMRHQAASVLVTPCAAKDVAAAMAKAGFKPGVRPVPVGDDRARQAAGTALEIDVVVKAADGKESRVPASRLLSARSTGEPLGPGAWVYVGPQVIREGGAEILITELSGSIATTNPRDSSAMIYWVPEGAQGAEGYVSAFYAASEPVPATEGACVLEFRSVAPAPK